MKKYYQAIPVGELQVDKILDSTRIYVQREELPQWTARIVANWDREMLLPALVSRHANGTYWLLDGQHSNKAAVEQEGGGFLRDCMVYEDLTPAQEAKLFLAANKHRKAVRPFDNFRVSLTAEDEVALRVQKEVRTVPGLEVASSPSTNRIGAVQALLALGSKRPGMVARVLKVAHKAWGADASTWDNMVLRALGMVLANEENWELCDDARLVKVLKAGGAPAIWKQNSVRATKFGGGSSSRSYPMVQQIIQDYNAGLSRDKVLVDAKARRIAA